MITLDMKEHKIAFIGAGNMSAAIIGGLISMGVDAKNIMACNPSRPKLDDLEETYGIVTSQDNAAVAGWADVIILGVKPQKMSVACSSILEHLTAKAKKKPLIISVAAGITIQSIETWLGDYPIVRSMPNTPSLIQMGATGLHANHLVDSAQKQLADTLFQAVGITVWVDEEKLINAVTAVSGSGPAYFFYFMEAIQAAGEELGLSPETAKQLTLQTALGAAQMASQGKLSPKHLRERVTSPGGTTQQALTSLSDSNLKQVVAKALQAADLRAEELACTFSASKSE